VENVAGSSTSANEGWLAGDGCGGPNPVGTGDEVVGRRSTLPSRLLSRSRISTRVLSFLVSAHVSSSLHKMRLRCSKAHRSVHVAWEGSCGAYLVGCGSLYLHSSFIRWHRPHLGLASSHFCFRVRQVSQAFNTTH